jgi:hypothetical protein
MFPFALDRLARVRVHRYRNKINFLFRRGDATKPLFYLDNPSPHLRPPREDLRRALLFSCFKLRSWSNQILHRSNLSFVLASLRWTSAFFFFKSS